MRVTTDDGYSGHGQSQLRTDYVYNTLFNIAERMEAHAKFRGVTTQGFDLGSRSNIRNGRENIFGGGIVIFSCDRQVETAQRPVFEA